MNKQLFQQMLIIIPDIQHFLSVYECGICSITLKFMNS